MVESVGALGTGFTEGEELLNCSCGIGGLFLVAFSEDFLDFLGFLAAFVTLVFVEFGDAVESFDLGRAVSVRSGPSASVAEGMH